MPSEKTMQKLRALILCSLVVFSFGAAGEICGFFFEKTETAFGNNFPDNKPEEIRKIVRDIATERRAAKPENRAGVPVAVMVVKGERREVVAVNLENGEKMWRLDVPISSEISLAGDLAIFKSGSSVIAHDVASGKPAWDYRLESGWDYYGADAHGDLVALSIGVGGDVPGGYANGRLVVLKAKNGSKIWDHGVGSGLLGQPVVIGNLVFAPWERQKIVVIDVDEGKEVCRVRATDYAIHFLKRASGALYYGSLSNKVSVSGIYRLDERSATGTREGSTVYVPDIAPVPGQPHFARNGFAKGIGGRSTEEKIRLHAAPLGERDGVTFSDGKFYLHYWEYLIAFDAATSKAVWTYRSPVTMESVDALASGGLLAVDTQGDLFHVDGATGAETWRIKTGERVLAARFDAEGFAPAAPSEAPPDPIQGLRNLIMDKDSRLLPIRAYAAMLLADIPNPEVTRVLLEVYSDPGTPKMLRDAVVVAIEKRKVGAEYLVDALKMRYDYLEQTQPPPMSIVAPALINMNEREAVPALLEHLMDHETPMADLIDIMAAIHKLGDSAVVAPLKQFMTLYHADTAFLKNEQVLASAAYTILKFGEKTSSQAFIADIRDDKQTLAELRKLLREVLNPEIVAREKAEAKAKAEAEAKAKAEAEAKAAEAARVPMSLSREEINQTVLSHQALFKPCVVDALKQEPSLRQIRMRFTLTGETGIASDVKILPHNIQGLEECISEALTQIAFRRFKNPRQMATYAISISSKE